jgi:lon-related putative ATP-dependent protease
MSRPSSLPASRLRRRTEPAELPFETTADLPPLERAVGQERALEAARFGLAMAGDGYNLIVIGPPGVGRRTLLLSFLAERATAERVPSDVCYVHDFQGTQQPRPLLVSAGRGRALKKELEQLVTELKTVLPQAFESDEFRHKRQAIETEEKLGHEKRLGALKRRAEDKGLVLVATPMGLAILPSKDDGVMPPEEFEQLPEEERATLQQSMDTLREELSVLVEELPRREKRARGRLRELVRETCAAAVRHHLDELRAIWEDEPKVVEFLRDLERDVIENVEDFVRPHDGSEGGPMMELGRPADAFRRYEVNLLVDHAETRGAPVVVEDHPTYSNLIGRVEHQQQLGALVTNFRLIRAGALHRANGGYLVLDARKLLTEPFAWEGLKRALRSREIRIESPSEMRMLLSTVTLEPGPVPLRLKVVLLAEPEIFYLLDRLDPDVRALFKVVVDFEDEIARGPETSLLYARLLGTLAQKEGLAPMSRSAVARLLEEASRRAGDAGKLSARVLDAFDLAREAAFFAAQRKSATVDGEDVDAAVTAQRRRTGRVRERVLEVIDQGTILIDTKGTAVGQVNGLAVLDVGRSAFGRPTRITAKVRLGKGEVVDIEREVELGGPIHSKGVLILSAFLGARYAAEHPLSLSATLVFEQSYGVVDGDSASCAEACALLSALAEVPISQAFAITGSVNQHGQVQAIGGVNEKIEGFFDVCSARGLTGKEGVVIPRSNERHLMLRDDVVQAVEKGLFHVHAVETVDEALELLTGQPAGERAEGGAWPEGSVNAKVEARLVALAQRRLELAAQESKKDGTPRPT